MIQKQRLDVLLHEKGLVSSREKARSMILAGEVNINGIMVDKPGTRVRNDVEITIKVKPRFVSRGGEKLARGLEDFAFNVHHLICADVGASTGGFTDCLLQNGAERVYAIDVGYGQLDYGLRQDDRVVVLERTNARHLKTLAEPIHLAVIDASFISLRLLLPVIKDWLFDHGHIIALIKPQFEAGRQHVGKGGVVRDPKIHTHVIEDIIHFSLKNQLYVQGLTRSPIKGPAGNVEFLIWLALKNENKLIASELQNRIRELIPA